MTDGTSLFFYGSMRYQPLLDVVFDRSVASAPAWLDGYATASVEGVAHSALRAAEGGRVEGLLVRSLSADDIARFKFYMGEGAYELRSVTVETATGQVDAQVCIPADAEALLDTAWDFDAWVAAWGEITRIATREVMAQFGRLTPAEIAVSYPQVLARAASSVRAATEPAPADLRGGTPREAVEVLSEDRPYLRYFGVGEQDLRFPLFNGGMSAPVRRAAFLTADAVTVLPYDPKRDRVLLIEQFRFGPFLRGDPLPWAIEPIAGRIDPGETPEEAARRETREEAHLDLGAMHEIGRYYPSPGAIAEWLVSYVGIADLPDSVAKVAGLAEEAEDIKSHVVSFDRLMALVESGEVAVGPLLLSAQWIALHKDRLNGLS